eukprot:3194711-Rhodomonas_salina.2
MGENRGAPRAARTLLCSGIGPPSGWIAFLMTSYIPKRVPEYTTCLASDADSPAYSPEMPCVRMIVRAMLSMPCFGAPEAAAPSPWICMRTWRRLTPCQHRTSKWRERSGEVTFSKSSGWLAAAPDDAPTAPCMKPWNIDDVCAACFTFGDALIVISTSGVCARSCRVSKKRPQPP